MDADTTVTADPSTLAVACPVQRCLNCQTHATRAVLISDSKAVLCEDCVRQAMSALNIDQPTSNSLLGTVDTALGRLHARKRAAR